MDIKIKGFEELTKGLDAMQRKQIPFATMKAINETANEVKKAEDRKIKRVFKKPTKATQNSVIILYAKKTRLEATVKIKDRPFSGSNASINAYLNPHIYGGDRSRKGSEKRLQSDNKMARGKSLFPGQGIKLNKFGNITKAAMKRMMVGKNYFSVKHGSKAANHLRPGIYLRLSKRRISPMVIYGDKATYQVRFRFYDVANKVIDKRLTRNFSKALDHALRTAR